MVEERWTSYGKVVGDPPTLRSLMPEAQLQASVMHVLSPWRAMREGKDSNNSRSLNRS